MARLVPDLLRADAHILPGIGTIRESSLGPPVLVPVARIRHIGIGKSKIFLCLRIVSRFMREIDLLAVPLLHVLVHMRHIDRLLLVGLGRRVKHEQVVPLPCRGFSGSFRVKIDNVDVIDYYVSVVLLSPLLTERPIKPGVVSWHEMTPLQYL